MGFADILAAGDRVARQQLGEAFTYTPGAGSAVPCTGIYDERYVTVDPGLGQPGVASSGPAVFLTLVDLSSDPLTDTGATVTRIKTGVVYTPYEVHKDGQGGVLLLLHLV